MGPVRIAYGTVIPAGMICRRDILEENRLFSAAAGDGPVNRARTRRGCTGASTASCNNLIYIGNIWALQAWYRAVRKRLMSGDAFAAGLPRGARWPGWTSVLEERVKRLEELAGRMPESLELARAERAGAAAGGAGAAAAR